MTVRYYSSTAPEVTLQTGVNNVSTVILVSSTTGFPVNTPYTLALDYGAATEELVEVTGVAGTSLTVTRAIDGTSAASHGAGAKVRHVSSARDFKDSRDHENASSGVHGVTGDVVGTVDVQTLSGKTLSSATLTGVTTANGLIDANAGMELTRSAGGPILDVTMPPGFLGNAIQLEDSASNPVFYIEDNGQIETIGGLRVGGGSGLGGGTIITEAADLATNALSVRRADLAPLFEVSSIEVRAYRSFDSTSTDVSGASLASAAAGWSIAANMIGVVKNGMITINGNITRTGANITIDAAGAPSTGIVAMCTIAAPVRQKASLGTLYFHSGNSIATGTLRMASAGGTIELVRWQANQTISTGNTLSFTLTYPLT